MLERALRIKERWYGKNHVEVAITLTNLGNAHGALGNARTKREMLERALRIKEAHYGPDHPLVATILRSLSNAHGAPGDATTPDLLDRAIDSMISARIRAQTT
jgi:hypothetical protein